MALYRAKAIIQSVRKSYAIHHGFCVCYTKESMTTQSLLTWSWLNVLTKKRYDALLEAFGSLDDALDHLDPEVLKQLGCKEETMMNVLNRKEEFNPAAYQKELEKRSLQLICIEDEQYPSALHMLPDPPIFLYAKGDLELMNQPCIGLVGTRAMSLYGKRVTEYMVPEFVRAGMVTVSGLAIGIDAHVAKETLAADGKTIAVLGHGLGKIHPKANAQLAERIVEEGGLLLSEFPLDAPPDKYTFPARNRIIAGITLGTVVLEAGEGSGALITADLALDYCREVFAVPGQIFDPQYAGCHQCIAAGRAKLVTSANEVLQELNIVAPDSQQTTMYMPSNPDEEKIYNALTTMPQSVTDIVKRSHMETGTINALLTMMELQGAVKNTGGGMWVRN